MVAIDAFTPYKTRTIMGSVKRKSKPYWADVKSVVKNIIHKEAASTIKTKKAEATLMCFMPIERVAKRNKVKPIVR